jgi:F-type H+-transporting ATPase subunit delta
MRGTIEGVLDDADAKFSEKMTKFLSEKIGKEIKLVYKKNDEMTAGYKVTVGDLQLDASLDNQLNKFKETVLNS